MTNPRLGKCYELSFQFIITHPEYKLVHGIITDNKFGSGKSLDHAWVEYNNEVYDLVLNITWPKEVYYGLYSVEVVTVYTSEEAIDIALEEGTYGPWNERLKRFKPVGF